MQFLTLMINIEMTSLLPSIILTFFPWGDLSMSLLANLIKYGSSSQANTSPFSGRTSAMPKVAQPVNMPISKTRLAREELIKNLRKLPVKKINTLLWLHFTQFNSFHSLTVLLTLIRRECKLWKSKL